MFQTPPIPFLLKKYRTLAMLLAALALTACGGGGGSSSNNQQASSSAQPQSPVTSFTVSPAALEFGKVVLGDSVQGVTTIRNTGNQSIDLEVVDLQDGFTMMNVCGVLQPDDECNLQIEFSPVLQKSYSASPTLVANSEQTSLDLSGQGQGLNVEITSITRSCSTSEISVDVSVTSASGFPVPGIRDENITVMLDGAEVALNDVLANAERTPIAVGLTIDWSGSLAEFRPQVTDATRLFIEQLQATDRAALYRFSQGINFEASQSFVFADEAGKWELLDALAQDYDTTGQQSRIWTAVNTVAEKVLEQPIDKRFVVLITDGLSNIGLELEGLINALESTGVQLFTIGYGNLDPTPLSTLANATGGLFFSEPDAIGISDAFDAISLVTSEGYTLNLQVNDADQLLSLLVLDDAGREGEDSSALPDVCP